jgi:hypothetical protein
MGKLFEAGPVAGQVNDVLEKAADWCLANPAPGRREPIAVVLKREFGLGVADVCEVARRVNLRRLEGAGHG